ncbi:hypothetical protein DIPPA_04522 [Diplonema papillatum]|nr:hypothetical protein DIPPA_04522 [Diplonema papillatum]
MDDEGGLGTLPRVESLRTGAYRDAIDKEVYIRAIRARDEGKAPGGADALGGRGGMSESRGSSTNMNATNSNGKSTANAWSKRAVDNSTGPAAFDHGQRRSSARSNQSSASGTVYHDTSIPEIPFASLQQQQQQQHQQHHQLGKDAAPDHGGYGRKSSHNAFQLFQLGSSNAAEDYHSSGVPTRRREKPGHEASERASSSEWGRPQLSAANLIDGFHQHETGDDGDATESQASRSPRELPPDAAPELSDEQSDAVFECKMLRKKLMDETASAKQAKDKVYFLMLKLKAKDEQIASLKESLRVRGKALSEKDSHIAQVTSERDEKARKAADLEARQMQNDYENYKLAQQASLRQPASESVEELRQRGSDKAKLQVTHQLYKQQTDKKVEQLRAHRTRCSVVYRQKLETLETNCMEYEDEFNTNSLQALMRTLHHGKTQMEREAKIAVSRDLRFNEKLTCKAPDDEHVDVLRSRSDYGEVLSLCKEDFWGTTKQLKELTDRALQNLWLLFNEKSSRLSTGGRHMTSRPFRKIFEEFYKTIDQALMRSKQLVADFARRMNAFTKSMVAREKEVMEIIRATRFSTCNVEVTADIRPPTPVEVYELRHEVSLYQRRLTALNEEMSEKEHTLELRASKAESNLEYLQRHIIHLHRSLFNALHLVYKHRYRWIVRMPDPIRNLKIPEAKDRQRALEVSFNKKLGEVLSADQKYMEAFGSYMVSEDFGTNTVTASTQEKRRRTVADDGFEAPHTQTAPTANPVGTEPIRLPKAPGKLPESVNTSANRGRRLSAADSMVRARASSGSRTASPPPASAPVPLPAEGVPSFAQPIGNARRRVSDSRIPSVVSSSLFGHAINMQVDDIFPPATGTTMRRADTMRTLKQNT